MFKGTRTDNNNINHEYAGPYESCSADLIKGLICIFENVNSNLTTEIALPTLRSERSSNNNDTFNRGEDSDEGFQNDSENDDQYMRLDVGSEQIGNNDNNKKYRHQFVNVLRQQPDYSSWIDRVLYLGDI